MYNRYIDYKKVDYLSKNINSNIKNKNIINNINNKNNIDNKKNLLKILNSNFFNKFKSKKR